MRSRPSGKKRSPGGAPLRWCDLVNDDLSGIGNWTEAIQKEFPALHLVVPEDPGFAAIKGAVRLGLHKAIASRTSYAMY